MNVLIPALLVAIIVGILRLLVKAGRGDRLATLSCHSPMPADIAFQWLEQAWINTGLTFRPVLAIDDHPDGSRSIYSRARDSRHHMRLKPIEGLDAGQIGMTILEARGRAFPLGADFHTIWSVEPEGDGSRISVELRLDCFFLLVPLMIGGAWWQLRGFASGESDYANPPAEGASMAPPPSVAPSPLKKPKRLIASFDPRDYVYEVLISLLAFVSFIAAFDLQSAIQLTLVILLHEYGHLLSFRLTGRQGNRMMVLPFMGGIAVAGSGHKSEFERAFCALAGPAICVPLSVVAFAIAWWSENLQVAEWAAGIAYYSCILNALNLLPIFPLDGGQIAEGYLRTYARDILMPALIILSLIGLMVLVSLGYQQMAFLIAILGARGLLTRDQMPSMRPMTTAESSAILAGYLLTALVHAGIYWYWWT